MTKTKKLDHDTKVGKKTLVLIMHYLTTATMLDHDLFQDLCYLYCFLDDDLKKGQMNDLLQT